jgi:hypothetical protein
VIGAVLNDLLFHGTGTMWAEGSLKAVVIFRRKKEEGKNG